MAHHDQGGVNTNALSRAVRSLSIGAIRAYDQDARSYDATALGEIDHQFQVPISGEAGGIASWALLEVEFGAYLLDARDERNSDYADPLFTYGSRISKGPPVVVACNVRRWVEEDGYYSGAVVEVGVFRPGAADSQGFAGEVHLNFQGYGAPSDESDDGEDES